MLETVRDSFVGRSIRRVTRGRYASFEEDKDPELWQKYISAELSRRMARYGSLTQQRTNNVTEQQLADQLNMHYARESVIVEHKHPEDFSSDESDAKSEKTVVETDVYTPDSLTPWDSYFGEIRVEGGRQNSRHELLNDVEIHPEKGKHVHIVHWFSDNDSENPRNWSSLKKAFITAQVSFATLAVFIAPSIYAPGEQSIMSDFGVSKAAATVGLTLSILGMGIGCMVWPSMSEVPKFGRSPIMIGTLFAFVVLQIPTALATNFGMFLAFRFIGGLFGGALLGVPGGTIGDLYSPAERSYVMLIWDVTTTGGPTLGPLMGGYVVEATGAYGWRWTMWELMILNGIVLLVMAFFLPETNPDTILCRRARRLRRITKNPRITTAAELESEQITVKDTLNVILVRPFSVLATEPIVLALNVYTGLVNAISFSFLEAFPFVFQDIYGFSLGAETLTFVGILIGYAIVVPPFWWYLNRYITPSMDSEGSIKPEKRLPPSVLGSIFIPICLFWFAWTSRKEIHWIVPLIGTGFFGAGSCLLYYSILNYLSDAYPRLTASVFGGNKFLIATMGSGFPIFATPMYKKLGVAWATSILGIITVAFIPIPILLLIYGRDLRRMSPRARNDI